LFLDFGVDELDPTKLPLVLVPKPNVVDAGEPRPNPPNDGAGVAPGAAVCPKLKDEAPPGAGGGEAKLKRVVPVEELVAPKLPKADCGGAGFCASPMGGC